MNICPTPKCYLPRPWVYQEKRNLVNILAKKEKGKKQKPTQLVQKEAKFTWCPPHISAGKEPCSPFLRVERWHKDLPQGEGCPDTEKAEAGMTQHEPPESSTSTLSRSPPWDW